MESEARDQTGQNLYQMHLETDPVVEIATPKSVRQEEVTRSKLRYSISLTN